MPEKAMLEHAPAYSFGIKTKQLFVSDTPGKYHF